MLSDNQEIALCHIISHGSWKKADEDLRDMAQRVTREEEAKDLVEKNEVGVWIRTISATTGFHVGSEVIGTQGRETNVVGENRAKNLPAVLATDQNWIPYYRTLVG